MAFVVVLEFYFVLNKLEICDSCHFPGFNTWAARLFSFTVNWATLFIIALILAFEECSINHRLRVTISSL